MDDIWIWVIVVSGTNVLLAGYILAVHIKVESLTKTVKKLKKRLDNGDFLMERRTNIISLPPSNGNFEFVETASNKNIQNPAPRNISPDRSENHYINQPNIPQHAVTGRKPPPKVPPKRYVRSDDNLPNTAIYANPSKQKTPSTSSYVSDDRNRKSSQMDHLFQTGFQADNRNYSVPNRHESDSSKPRSNLDNDRYYY